MFCIMLNVDGVYTATGPKTTSRDVAETIMSTHPKLIGADCFLCFLFV